MDEQRVNDALAACGVPGVVESVATGAAVDRFDVRLAQGTPSSKLTGLEDTLARDLRVRSVRVVPVNETGLVGLEVPAAEPPTVTRGEAAAAVKAAIGGNPDFMHPLTFPVGRTVGGDWIVANLRDLPHLLVSGVTKSGKSVFLNGLICHIVEWSPPADVQFAMVDTKQVELAPYRELPHLWRPVATSPSAAIHLVEEVVDEMGRRQRLMADAGARDVDELHEPPPYLVVVVDEAADVMLTGGKPFGESLGRLMAVGRALGIHVVLATQLPSAEVLPQTVRAQSPSRVSFAVQNATQSRIALGDKGAELLLGRGDGLWSPAGLSGPPVRFQGAYLTGEEVDAAVAHAVEQWGAPPSPESDSGADAERVFRAREEPEAAPHADRLAEARRDVEGLRVLLADARRERDIAYRERDLVRKRRLRRVKVLRRENAELQAEVARLAGEVDRLERVAPLPPSGRRPLALTGFLMLVAAVAAWVPWVGALGMVLILWLTRDELSLLARRGDGGGEE